MYIGIDLGTSNSSIAGVEQASARVFRPTDGGEALPSVIYIDKRGHRLYGRRAYDQSRIAPENVASGFKRLIGTSTPIEITGADVTMTPEECSAEIIRQLVGQVTTESGIEKFEGVVIGIPASFNQMQTEATLRAAHAAGLEKVDLVQEPVAAALASMVGAKRSGKFLIYDLGGGTFDVALIGAEQGQVHVIGQQGINMLGGRDFDRMIVNEVVRPWLLANFDLPDNFLRDPSYRRLARIAHLAAEKAKIDLSTLEVASVFASDDEIRLTDQNETDIFLDAPITRSQLEELIRRPIEQTVDLIRALLDEYQVPPADVDRIVFVGGPSRIPLVRRLVTEALGIEADLNTDPVTAVAEGAAYYAEGRLWKSETAPAPTSEVLPVPIESAAKPTEGHADMEGEPDLFFDFDLRTPDEKTTISVHLDGQPDGRTLRLTTEGWDSGAMPLTSQMAVTVPLATTGENVFDVQVTHPSGNHIEQHARTLTITRTVAAPKAVPATHSIAVKARLSADADENSFLYLVKKGDKLPASGELQLKSATDLRAGGPGTIRFEVFQVEIPERVELNLCVGLFRIESNNLPHGVSIKAGDPVTFVWRMSEGGILQASVRLPSSKIELSAPRFFAPQAAEISFGGEAGRMLTKVLIDRAREDWGELAAALGPDSGPDIGLIKTRLDEQADIFGETPDDPETARQVSEEVRFIRQDTIRLGRKYTEALLQRQLGKLQAVYNRIARGAAAPNETKAFDDLAMKVQKIIDSGKQEAFPAATLCLGEMRKHFFAVAWRRPDYLRAWFERLSQEPWLFADQDAFRRMIEEGKKIMAQNDAVAMRQHVVRLLEARITLGASDDVSEMASVVKG